MKILLSAYSCEPDRGSEPAVGWNIAKEVARFHDVWVLTRKNNRDAIENELKRNPQPRIHWEFLDPPRQLTFWKQKTRGLLPFYYLWQWVAYQRARDLNLRIGFDVIHHVTLTQYWTPSYLALIEVPFVWGPLGGADKTPDVLMESLDWRGRLLEKRRQVAQGICTSDPLLRTTARRAAIALAATEQTGAKLRALGCRRVENFGCFGLSTEDLAQLGRIPIRDESPIRLVSFGRLLGWKGFHLGIAAFARVHQKLPGSDYWIFGHGSERRNLENLAQQLGIGNKVRFFGDVPRNQVLTLLAECDLLIHPSFHDAGAMVCNEAMAAGRPVICLDLGGPATQVTRDTGFKIAAGSPEEVIKSIAEAIGWLARNPSARRRMGAAARLSAQANHAWSLKGQQLSRWYDEIVQPPATTISPPLSSAAL
jgi:glycosyltransferase involved in cell wall biosynthesis